MPLLIGPPPNRPALVHVDSDLKGIEISYGGRELLHASVQGLTRLQTKESSHSEMVEQVITLVGEHVRLTGTVSASCQSFAAETNGLAQRRFPLVRNSDGPSHNLRNNAIYDRAADTLLAGPSDGSTRIEPLRSESASYTYSLSISGKDPQLVFKPRFYQKHKNIPFFEPWKKPLTQRPISGWCSWWAYRTEIDLTTVGRVAETFSKRLAKYGFRVIQLDDGYESGEGHPPGFWLDTTKNFPGGIPAIAAAIKKVGLEPGIWVGTQIDDDQFAKSHASWFVRNSDGSPHKGPWIGYGVDGHNPEGLNQMYGPVWSTIKNSGFSYVKIDSLRHLLYDSLYPSRAQVESEGSTPEKSFRSYLEFARKQLDPKTYILACWGVLPEAAGIVDACRLGGDGFGPSTMQQYNSWNNVVWRNDPDHVDLQGKEEAIIRPTLVSMAGAQLLLSDKAEFYEVEANLEGAKRASPVPLTHPGQLYDYDPSKTDNLIAGLRNQNGGSNAGPIDATQRGEECPWWQLDIGRAFENWTVLARLSWKTQPEQKVLFSDLGLSSGRYTVYEFWSHHYLGEFEGGFPAEAQEAKVAHVYCIRKVVDHPQVVSTNRHITQGGPDLGGVSWLNDSSTLVGVSKTVEGDPYEIRIRCAGRKATSSNLTLHQEGDFAVLSCTPGPVHGLKWWVHFQ
jgi:alpha-galactosidase